MQPATGPPLDTSGESAASSTTGLPSSSGEHVSNNTVAPPLSEASTEDHDPLLPTLTEGQRAGESSFRAGMVANGLMTPSFQA